MPPDRAGDDAQRWLNQARRDIEDAKFNVEGGRYSVGCFLAQQAGEKIVTAYLYFRGADDVWGHSLSDLCEDAMAFDPGFDALKSTAALLDKFFEMTRYPTGLPGGIPADAFDESDGVRAVQIANEVLDFVVPRMEL
jgi:HEPN domain-containing protein